MDFLLDMSADHVYTELLNAALNMPLLTHSITMKDIVTLLHCHQLDKLCIGPLFPSAYSP